jgi:hypothetical protein
MLSKGLNFCDGHVVHSYILTLTLYTHVKIHVENR